MKILYLAHHQVFSGDHAGFTHVYNITRHLAALGHELTLVARPPPAGSAPPPPPEGVRLRYAGWELEYPLPFGPPERLRSQLNILEPAIALRWLKNIIEEEGVDVIQERHEMRLDLAPLSTKLMGIPSVLEVNSPFLEESFPEGSFSFRSRNFFRRMGFGGANAIIVQTRLLKEIISKHTSTPIHVIPNGADPEHFTPSADPSGPARALWGGGKGGDIIGFAGAFHPWHGALDLVEAFSKLAQRELSLRLLMMGSGGEDLEKCRKLVRRRGLEARVRFTGGIPYTELPRYLNMCSVLAAPFAPSKDEKRRELFKRYGLWWCPLKIFEYMAMAKPVVCSSVGAIPDYIRGAGLLYPEGDTEALVDRLSALLADPGLRERLGRAGRERVEKEYNWLEAAKKTLAVYEGLVERRA
ncbi:MAG: glycosyltransferase family 4 protein [Thermoplasmata archaeon]